MKVKSVSEWHPWLKLFTILAIPAGIMVTPMGFFMAGNPQDPGSVLLGILWIPVALGGTVAAIYVLAKTDYYRKWSQVTGGTRIAAYYAIYLGLCLAIALIIVLPFMRFITDSIGGGLGVSKN